MNRTLCATAALVFLLAMTASHLQARGFGGYHGGGYPDDFVGGLWDSALYRLAGINNLTVGQFSDSYLAGVGRGEYMPAGLTNGDVGHPRFGGLHVGGQNDGRFSPARVSGIRPTGFHLSAFPSGLRPDASAARARTPVPSAATSGSRRPADYRALPSDGGLHFLSGPTNTDF